jgi:hypothetical protein
MFSRPRLLWILIVLGVLCAALANCGTAAGPLEQDDVFDAGPADSGQVCSGVCVAPAPSGWHGPALLWRGSEDKAPSCPGYAPEVLYEGHADLIAPGGCASCTCGAPTGSCAPMSTITMYYSEIACQVSPDVFPFDPPPNWDGSCAANISIPAYTFNTYRIGPLQLTETGCAPDPAVPELNAPPPSWVTYALVCAAQGSQCNSGDFCFPKADPLPDGFALCVVQQGLHDCPEAYPHPQTFYDGVEDGRACSPCECGAPVGSDCFAQISLWQDSACTDLFLLTGVTLQGPGGCTLSPDPFPPPWSLPVESKSLGPRTYTPGTCTPMGGEPIGAATAMGPSTLCCRD